MSPEILLTKKRVDVEVMVGEVMASPSGIVHSLFHWWSAVAVAKARQNTSEASPSGPSRLLFHWLVRTCDRL